MCENTHGTYKVTVGRWHVLRICQIGERPIPKFAKTHCLKTGCMIHTVYRQPVYF